MLRALVLTGVTCLPACSLAQWEDRAIAAELEQIGELVAALERRVAEPPAAGAGVRVPLPPPPPPPAPLLETTSGARAGAGLLPWAWERAGQQADLRADLGADVGADEPEPRARRAASRLADGPARRLQIHATERAGLHSAAGQLAALSPAAALAVVLDYGATPAGLEHIAKVLHLMPPQARAAILERLRPAELRVFLELPVAGDAAPHAGPGMPAVAAPETGGTPSGTPMGTPAAATTRPPEGQAALPGAGRYQVAGTGAGAWKTVLDTRTGVVYNYRAVDGRPGWWPITTPLVE